MSDTAPGRAAYALILFGPPGSGKGTQAKFIKDWLGFPHISTGDMLREHMDADDELGRAILTVMRSGALVPDEMVNRMVEERIDRPDCRNGFILDGYPRTLAQGEWLVGQLEKRAVGYVVVHLKVDYNEVIGRLAARRQCPQCGTIYNLVAKPPLVPGRCDIEGANLVVRADDREEVIRKRLGAYELQTQPLLEFFGGRNGLHEVDTSGWKPEQIAARIREWLRPT